MVCEAINIESTIGLFFSFFEIKGVEKGDWIIISSLPGKSFLQVYTTNYKGFKDWFLRVRCMITPIHAAYLARFAHVLLSFSFHF